MVSFMEEKKQDIRQFLNINTLIIAVNVLLFLWLSMIGDTRNEAFLLNFGAMYPEFLQQGEWWRLVTAMFLHFGIEHLLSNMFMLWFVGNMLLKALKPWQYAIVYLISGLGGSLASYEMMVLAHDYAISAGASGAIYGIVGALFWVVLRHGGRFETIRTKQMVLAVVCYVSYGFTTEGVDAWAHLGGMVAGFLMTAILYHPKKQD